MIAGLAEIREDVANDDIELNLYSYISNRKLNYANGKQYNPRIYTSIDASVLDVTIFCLDCAVRASVLNIKCILKLHLDVVAELSIDLLETQSHGLQGKKG